MRNGEENGVLSAHEKKVRLGTTVLSIKLFSNYESILFYYCNGKAYFVERSNIDG